MSAGGAAELAAVVTFNKQGPEEEHLYTSPYGQMGDYRVEDLRKGIESQWIIENNGLRLLQQALDFGVHWIAIATSRNDKYGSTMKSFLK